MGQYFSSSLAEEYRHRDEVNDRRNDAIKKDRAAIRRRERKDLMKVIKAVRIKLESAMPKNFGSEVVLTDAKAMLDEVIAS